MSYLSIVALPFYNTAKIHLLVVSEMSKRELEIHYERTVGGGYVLEHRPLVAPRIARDAIFVLFGEEPDIAVAVKGYSIESLKMLVHSISTGAPCELPEREEIIESNEEVYSLELQEEIPYLSHADGEIVAAISDEETEVEYDDDDLRVFDEEEFDAIDEMYPSDDEDDEEKIEHNKRMELMYDLLSGNLEPNDTDGKKMIATTDFVQD